MQTVPRIIHQTWRDRNLPRPVEICTESIVRLNPGWKHAFYTDATWHEIFAENTPFGPADFAALTSGILKADVFRVAALHRYGGVYADVDMLALRPLDGLLDACKECGLVEDDTEIILTTDHPIHCAKLFGGNEILMNNFMIAKPQARFFTLYLEVMRGAIRSGGGLSGDPVMATGPVAITRLVERFGGLDKLKIAVVPYFWINPLPDMCQDFAGRQGFEKIITDGSWRHRFCPYLVHLWWHTYHSPSNMMDMYPQGLFGEAWGLAGGAGAPPPGAGHRTAIP